MKVLIAGGGTGGHVYPGLAVADALKNEDPKSEILFVGTTRGIEESVVPRAGYAIRFIRVEGLVGRGLVKTIVSAARVPCAIRESMGIIDAFDPDVVLGVGGYASGPAVFAAWMKGIPTLVHEQNSVPGLTNRILGRFVDAVAITYNETKKYFQSAKTFTTGNPIRAGIAAVKRPEAARRLGIDSTKFTVLLFGGSRGAHSMNRAMVEALPQLLDLRQKLQIVHQTGVSDHKEVLEAYREQDFHGVIVPYIHEMDVAFAAADLVVCRAGASTLAEVTACGKASILIPYPFAAGNHQEMNARKLVDLGASRMIRDEELSGPLLAQQMRELMSSSDLIGEMARVSRTLGRPDAGPRIVELLRELGRVVRPARDGGEGP